MIEKVKVFFEFEKYQTSFRNEIVAGITTFMTMSYIIVVNPKILEAAGIPLGPSMVATILTAAFGTLLMGLYAKRPFGIAPYMGENAFIAYTVVVVLGYSWQMALAAVFIGGVLFILLTAFAVIILMSFTFNIGVGITAGFVLYPIFKLVAGRHHEINPGLWVLCGLSVLFYIFYPYT